MEATLYRSKEGFCAFVGVQLIINQKKEKNTQENKETEREKITEVLL